MGALVTVAMAAAVLVGVGSGDGRGSDPARGVTAASDDIAGLVAFDGCDELTSHVRDVLASSPVSDIGVPATMAVGAEGARGFGGPGDGVAMDRAVATADQGSKAAPPAPAPDTDTAVSTTNVQEVGIDEPDIVETDGRLLLAVTGNELHIVDVTAERPQLASSVGLGEGQHQLFLLGDRALVMSRTWHHPRPEPLTAGPGDPALSPVPFASTMTDLTLLDLTQPTAPVEEATATVDGDLVSARATDGTVRLVLRSWPQEIDLRMPVELAAIQAARRHNRSVLDTVDARQVLPHLTVTDRQGRTIRHAPAVDCSAVSRPAAPSGVGTTTVLTLRPEDGDLLPEDSTSVLADSQVVYASTDRLYVATSTWPFITARGPAGTAGTADTAGTAGTATEDEPRGPTTELHAFDVTAPAATRHVASGEVEGRLLNQWSLSERDRVLRVAVTRDRPTVGAPPGPGADTPAEPPSSDSAIVTLRERDGRLERIGEVGGLGPGERIYAVRYFDDLATVVTFRQIDPLYTVDLSDPADPRVLGELKIPGFSNYLHPIGDDQLLGVGQDADEDGRQLGVQVSLFDIGDLAAPERTANLVLGQGHSEVQHDHNAFLWWPADDLAVVPLEQWGIAPPTDGDDVAPGQPWAGAVLVEMDREAGALREVARITHADDGSSAPTGHAGGTGIRRAVVVGDRLLTVSDAGVEATDLATYGQVGWLGF